MKLNEAKEILKKHGYMLDEAKKTNQTPVSALDGDQIEHTILQLLVVAHQKSSEGGRISVSDLSNKYFKNNKYDDILDALSTSMDSGFVDYDAETNGDYFFILPRGIKFLRDNEIMPAKNTSYKSVIDGTLEFEAPAKKNEEKPVPAKKPIDLDDDMHDDTPIVKQRDESFKAFAEKQGYSFVNESSQGYKLVKFITKNLKMPVLRKVSAVMQDFTNSVRYDFDDNIVAAIDDPDVDTVVRIISELSPAYAKRIVVEEDRPVEIEDDNED